MQIAYEAHIEDIVRLAAKYPEITGEEASKVMDLVVRRFEADVAAKTPTGVGGEAGLRGSIFGETKIMGRKVTGLIGTPLEYAKPVEYGTKPHMPPIRPIILWAARKLGLSGAELRRAARAIQWKIFVKGTEGAHMFEETFKATRPWANDMFKTVPRRVVDRIAQLQ